MSCSIDQRFDPWEMAKPLAPKLTAKLSDRFQSEIERKWRKRRFSGNGNKLMERKINKVQVLSHKLMLANGPKQ